MARKKEQLTDPQIEAANEIYKTARAHADEEISKLKGEIDDRCFESHAMGILHKITYDQKHNEMLKYAVLFRVKKSKEYRKAGMTWEDFCESIGESVRSVDKVLEDLRPIVNEFSAHSADLIGMPLNKIRYLGRLVNAESAEYAENEIIIDGQHIPLTPEHKDDIEALIDSLKEAQKQVIEEKDATLRAKDKLLKAKEQLINRQEKELARYEGRAEKLGYTPGEEVLIQNMDNARTTIDGFLMQFDPERNPLPEDATPRMRAKLMHTLDYFRRVILAAYDTAADLYGEPELDDDWVPPHLRARAGDGEQPTEQEA